jgi:hypothetical protein
MMHQLAAHLRPEPPAVGIDLTTREIEALRLLAEGKSTVIDDPAQRSHSSSSGTSRR